ncbi:MAG: redoxin domain-containing protein [Verrucomicrobiota bacterium]
MNRLSHLSAAMSLLLAAAAPAAPADAQRLEKKWQLTLEQWSLETRVATTAEARAKVWNARPDVTPIARQMWEIIGPSLAEEWSLEPAAWFLQATTNLLATRPDGSTAPTFAKETDAIRKALEAHHLKSPKLIPVCMALAATRDARSLAVLEKIQAGNPDPKTQGVAALGAAMILKTLGDDPELTRKRLTDLRQAIIQSADVDLGGTTVAKLAEDELYIIRYLAKGRVAPDLSGIDSAGLPLQLSNLKNQVIVLLFWNSTCQDVERVVQITRDLVTKFQGRPLVVLGVCNDPLPKLRALEADSTVTWRNLSDPANKLAADYRIGAWPLVYVLDGERKIHYVGPPGSFADLTAEALLSEIKPAAKE